MLLELLSSGFLAASQTALVGGDPHSFSNPDKIRAIHLDLDLEVDFETRKLRGHVDMHIQRDSPSAKVLILDTRDLTIQGVGIRTRRGWEDAKFRLSPPDPVLGRGLYISVGDEATKVRVKYETSPEATGLQWLKPEQTAGKKYPFLYSQAQAIHARSFIPLQDTPQVRTTYSALIRTSTTVRAVMSASNDPQSPKNGRYRFVMPQAVPSYLIALAVGDLRFQAMSKRTGVYAEPAYLQAAAREFEDTEKMLEVVEKAFGPYQWNRYDLLILPPSFPFGGMENPRLSFITPTVIAGDKSLVALIAHELAHSWSGNSVTNATWSDLWLNEGFTTYLTYRIMELVYGERRYAMERELGLQSLEAELEELEPRDQRLLLNLVGRDPDDAFSEVPYEKGALLLFDLEKRVGRENFDAFLKQYFEDFAFRSLRTVEFVTYLKENLYKKFPEQVDLTRLNRFVSGEGLPSDIPRETSDAFRKVEEARTRWLEGGNIVTAHWSVHEWLHFLKGMPGDLSPPRLKMMDSTFKLSESTNNEVLHQWFLIIIRNNYQPVFPRLRTYLQTIGRRKLIQPLYEALMVSDHGRSFAENIYEIARPGYHYIAQRTIDKIVRKK